MSEFDGWYQVLLSDDIDPSKDNVPYAAYEERYDAQYVEMDQLKKK